MELLTRNNFEGWMQKLMERLDRQDELLLAMKAEGKQPTITESIRLFDNQDLCMLLQISKRTLQRYRSVGALPYKTLGKKTYYSEVVLAGTLCHHISRRQATFFPTICKSVVVVVFTYNINIATSKFLVPIAFRWDIIEVDDTPMMHAASRSR